MSSCACSDRKASANSQASTKSTSLCLPNDLIAPHIIDFLFDPTGEVSRKSCEELATLLLGSTTAERCKSYAKSCKDVLSYLIKGNINGARKAFDAVEGPWSSESGSSNSSQAPGSLAGRMRPGPPPGPLLAKMMKSDEPNTSASTQRGKPGPMLTSASGEGGAVPSRPQQPGTTAQQPRPYAGQTAPSQSNKNATGNTSSQGGPFTNVRKPGASEQPWDGPQTNIRQNSAFSNARPQPPGTQNQSAAPSWQWGVPPQSSAPQGTRGFEVPMQAPSHISSQVPSYLPAGQLYTMSHDHTGLPVSHAIGTQ